jgi:DNA-binding transcriptional LysR family regulator
MGAIVSNEFCTSLISEWGITVELRHLEHFVAVAEERSFTRAASRVHLVQSALSVSIQSLERELDTRLFERTTHQVALTDAGQALLPEARRTLEAAAAARSAVTDANEGMRGTLRLGLMQSLTLVDVAGLIARFHRERPLVVIRPRPATGGSASLAEEVGRGTLDAAFIATGGPSVRNVSVRALAAEPLLFVCPTNHHLAQRKVVTPELIRDETFVEFVPGWGIRTAVDQLFAGARTERSIAVEVPDVSTCLALIKAGLGVGFLTGSILGSSDGLVGINVRPAAMFEIGLAVPSVGPPSAVTQAFVDLVDAGELVEMSQSRSKARPR